MALTIVQKTILGGDPLLPADGAVCTILKSGLAAPIYTNRAGTILADNPLTVGSDGLLKFYVEPGVLEVQVSHATGNVTYPDFLAVSDTVVLGPAPTAEFETLADMVNGVTTSGTTIDWDTYEKTGMETVYHNLTSKAGGAKYTIKTVAQAAADGDVIDGTGAPNYYGANHALTGGTHVAILAVEIPFVESLGVKSNGVDDDTDAFNAASAWLKNKGAGAVQLDPSRAYIINGGSNTPYSERGVTMTDGWVLPSNSTAFLNGATIKSSSGGPTSSNQTRLITNETKSQDATVTRSENIKIVGPANLEFTGTTGYYCNAIWINGGPLIGSYAFDEYFAKNISIEGIIETNGMRGSLVVRDENVFGDTGVADSEDKRMAGQITFDTIFSRNGTSFTASLDGDYIDGNIVKGFNDTLSGFDCFSVIRGHHINVNMIHAKNCAEYGCIIRSINNSNTRDINVGLLTIQDGQGLLIADDSNQTLTEITEEIHIGTAHIIDSGVSIEQRSVGGNTSIRDIQIGQLHMSKGKSGGVLMSIGLRCEGVSSVYVDSLYADNLDGECVVIKDSSNIGIDIKRAKRTNTTDDILQVIRSSDCSIDLRRSTGGNNCIYLEGDGTTGLDRNEIRVGSATGFANFLEINQNSTAISSSTKIFVNNSSNLSLTRANAPVSLSSQFPTEKDYVGNMSGFGAVKTISAGVITVDYEKHRVDTEGSAASDDLDTMLGGYRGQTVIIGEENSSRDVNYKTRNWKYTY